MAPSWLQILKDYIGYEGATSLADKMTAARAGYLDNINNSDLSIIPNISTLSVARIGYLDNINQVGLLQITAVRAGYLDNIDNANLSTIPDISTLSAVRIGYLDELDFDLQGAVGAIPTTAMRGTDSAATVADGWDAALATILDNFTAARIGYLDELDFDLQTAIAAIPTAMVGTNSAFLAAVGGALADAAASGVVTNADTAMAYIKQLVTEGIARDTAIGTVDTVVDGIQTDLSNGTDGLGALKALLDAIPTDAMRGTNSAALASSWTAALATALGNYNATRAGYLDQLDFNLQEDIAAIPITAMRGTDSAFLASVGGLLNDAAAAGAVTDADTAMAYIKQLVTAAIANATAVGLIPTTAMRGTDGAALVASGWDATLATILDNFSAARIGYLDNLSGGAVTAVGPTNAQMNTARDAVIAAIPAMVGTNGAALASAWTAALATALASYTAVRGGYLDELAAANLPADIDAITAAGPTKAEMDTAHGLLATEAKQDIIDTNVDDIETSIGRALYSMDFWSNPVEEKAVTAAQVTAAVGAAVVVADLPAGATITRAIVMMKFRMVENTNVAANSLDCTAVQPIQVDDSANTGWVSAIDFVDEQFKIAKETREGGDVLIGDNDVAARVDGNDTYDFQWLNAKAHLANIQFNDIQMGLRIWYSV